MKTLSKSIFGLFVALAMILSLSNGQTAGAVASSGENLSATTPPLLSNIQAIDLGGSHTCALTSGGGVKCWGYNHFGQLGDGTIVDSSPAPIDVSGLTSGITAISAGVVHTCALTSGGGVKCWGNNDWGQLGDGTTTPRTTPVDVIGLAEDVIAISAGAQHTCALTSGGGMKCWGSNAHGRLGDGTTTKRLTPVDVSGLTSGINAISAGESHTCALTSGGGVKCWGYNAWGQLGDGTTTQRRIPTDVFGLTNGIDSISSGYTHTCAVTSSGGAMCWGNNLNGRLGDGTTTQRLTPTDVFGLTIGITLISSGASHTCALTSSGGAMCWGNNRSGQLGDGTTTRRLAPVGVSGLTSGINVISAGGAHSCAPTSGGGVKCWGDNSTGQLGNGTVTKRLTPFDVLMLDKLIFRSIGAQDGHIWESTENSGVGLKADSTNTIFRVGDDNRDRQYRGFLSFNTSPLPDTAVLISAVIQLQLVDGQGSSWELDPFLVDIRKPFFGDSISLLPNDFQSAPSMHAANINIIYGFEGEWLKKAALPYINLIGRTQFRLRFQKDDNDNMRADYRGYYSGDAQFINRPRLVIYYYVP